MKDTVPTSTEISAVNYLYSDRNAQQATIPVSEKNTSCTNKNPEIIKGNAVQNILTDSVGEEMRHRWESTGSRLQSLPPNISEITDYLILTSASSVNAQNLQTFDVSCVISCAPELPDSPLMERMLYHKVAVTDSGCSRIMPYFDEAANLIQQASSMGKTVLVFCVAGVSRSASICIAYLMKHHKLTLLEAYNLIKSRRPRIRPNCGFFKQLIEYEKNLFGCNSVQMVFNSVVQMEIPDVYEDDYKVVSYSRKKITGNKR